MSCARKREVKQRLSKISCCICSLKLICGARPKTVLTELYLVSFPGVQSNAVNATIHGITVMLRTFVKTHTIQQEEQTIEHL